MIRCVALVSVLFLFSLTSQAQMPGYISDTPFFSPADSQKVFVSINVNNFFKNNEYFNPIEEGLTLLGFSAQPSVIIQLTKDTRMEAGANMLKYSGRSGFYQIEPLFRFQYQPTPWFQMVLGSIYGGSYHKLLEPLYRWELHFTNPLESGLQFLLNTNRLNTDVWLSWEKFILAGDPFQEKLTVGISSEFFLTDKTSSFIVSCPVQTLFNHHGGQINSVDVPLQTLANWATGVKVHKQMSNCFLEGGFYYFGYSDLSPQKLQQYRNGYGLYPKTKFGFHNFSVELGYFHGTRFVAPMGEALFHSASIPASDTSWVNKNLCTTKLCFEKKIGNGIHLGTYFESYTSFSNGQTDYCYGVHILLNRDFFLFKFR